jgi:hypothetical protein
MPKKTKKPSKKAKPKVAKKNKSKSRKTRRTIAQYLPDTDKDFTMVQARVDSELVLRVKRILKSRKHKMKDFVRGCMERFVEENK